jgi:DNA adenine methylase
LKPLFIWAGGKTKMFKHYKDLMPPVEDIHSYSEPFLGGGAMFLYVIKKYDIKKAYLNDINHDIIGIYENIKNHPQDFCVIVDDYQCRFIPLTKLDRKRFYYEVREEYIDNYDNWSYLQKSAVLYFLMKTAFNGIWQSSKKANGKFYTPSGSYDPPYRDSFTNYSTIFPDSEHKLLIERVESNKNVWLCNRDAGDGFFDGCDAILKTFPVTYTAGRRKKTDDGYKAKKATEILLYKNK